ncbi:MAG TPA: DUF3106 domain-containing protein [Bryobacteraceae bacterium]|nr:DUF3106 domain-containing protein [Bryobacteraceae bacterium]
MRCDWSRAAVLGLGLALTMGLAPARCQPPADTAQEETGEATGTPLDRWLRMTPEERERELDKLPPARARIIRQQLHRYAQMSPAERQKLRERYQTFEQLPPDLQQIVRQRLREFRLLPRERQVAVHRAVLALRAVPQNQRAPRMRSEEMKSRFSPDERQMILDLANYLDTRKPE